MHTLRHVWMKTYLQMKRLVSAQAMPLGLSPGSPRSWNISRSTANTSKRTSPLTAKSSPPPWEASFYEWRPPD